MICPFFPKFYPPPRNTDSRAKSSKASQSEHTSFIKNKISSYIGFRAKSSEYSLSEHTSYIREKGLYVVPYVFSVMGLVIIVQDYPLPVFIAARNKHTT